MPKVNTDEEWLGHSTIFHWYTAFFEGRETSALLLLAEQPLSICTEEMVTTVTATVREDCHIMFDNLRKLRIF